MAVVIDYSIAQDAVKPRSDRFGIEVSGDVEAAEEGRLDDVFGIAAGTGAAFDEVDEVLASSEQLVEGGAAVSSIGFVHGWCVSRGGDSLHCPLRDLGIRRKITLSPRSGQSRQSPSASRQDNEPRPLSPAAAQFGNGRGEYDSHAYSSLSAGLFSSGALQVHTGSQVQVGMHSQMTGLVLQQELISIFSFNREYGPQTKTLQWLLSGDFQNPYRRLEILSLRG